ncbi:_partial [Hexamita inflata]|uniref:Partial n=1 Tax=Hexamita inflata TaxID=28002 RepID=A0AA86UPK4_9EUKA|nr:internalin [Hexamita inflata]
MTHKYQTRIKDGSLEIGDWLNRDQEVTNLKFIEKFNIQTLKLYINDLMSLKLRSYTIKELSFEIPRHFGKYVQNWKVDDLELENLEVLQINGNQLENNKLFNLVKFKKLHTLDVSNNSVDLTHIHGVKSLTKLSMRSCGLNNIDQVSSLTNLKVFDLSANKGVDLSPLCKVKSLTKLSIQNCDQKNSDQISVLINLEDLDLSANRGLIINSLYKINNLTRLSMQECDLKDIDLIVLLTNLEVLDISWNKLLNIDSISQLVNLNTLRTGAIFCNLNKNPRGLVYINILIQEYNRTRHKQRLLISYYFSSY